MKHNWKAATRAQLYEIAFNDRGASLCHRLAAIEEIKRRNRLAKISGKPIEKEYAKRVRV